MIGERCIACGRTNPPGGLRLNHNEDDPQWICRRHVECAQEIARWLAKAPPIW